MTDDEARAEVERLIAAEIAKMVGQPLDDVEVQVRELAERLIRATYGESLVEIEVLECDGDTLRAVATVDAEWCVGLAAQDLRAMGMDVGEAIPGDAVMVIVGGEIGWLRADASAL